ncbi:MAG TPA: serine/threonine-protein kinase, partial [Myxococcaceae bacterium]|nr:serine/threonine-protein kinase [Myxococcaceae bacterium]
MNPAELPPGTCLGSWRLVRRLGQGGYGVVYQVEQRRAKASRKLPRYGALKLALWPGACARRLAREAKLLLRVRHPNVVRYVDAGLWPDIPRGQPFLVMEYVEGPHLYAFSAERNLTVRETVEFFRVLADALHAVHAAGAFHRDVKGENVIIRRVDGRPMLVDFGAGDYDGATPLTSAPLPPGTPPYRSPEALRFQREHLAVEEAHYDFRPTDEVYALGVTLYRVLTDEYPYETDWPEEALRKRLQGGPPASPSSRNPRLPEALSEVVLRMMAHRPEDRPQSMRAVQELLRAALADAGAHGDSHLFEWYDGPSENSRTTENTDAQGPVAPGDEQALLQGEIERFARQASWRLKRTVRKRRRPAAVASQSPPPSPSTSSMPAVRPGALTRRGVALACGGLVLLGTVAFVLPALSGPPTRPEHPMEEDPTVKAPKMKSSTLKSTAAATCLGTAAACATPSASFTETEVCPEGAITAMRHELGLRIGYQGLLIVDPQQPEWGNVRKSSPYGFYRTGPIVSRVSDDAGLKMPEGTLLFGELWTDGARLYGRYRQIQLPDGKRLPVCIELGGFGKLGIAVEPGPQPDTVTAITQQSFVLVR